MLWQLVPDPSNTCNEPHKTAGAESTFSFSSFCHSFHLKLFLCARVLHRLFKIGVSFSSPLSSNHSVIHSIYCVASTMLGARDTREKKIDLVLGLSRSYNLVMMITEITRAKWLTGTILLVLTITLPGKDYCYPHFTVLNSLSCLLRVTELVRAEPGFRPWRTSLMPNSVPQNASTELDGLIEARSTERLAHLTPPFSPLHQFSVPLWGLLPTLHQELRGISLGINISQGRWSRQKVGILCTKSMCENLRRPKMLSYQSEQKLSDDNHIVTYLWDWCLQICRIFQLSHNPSGLKRTPLAHWKSLWL